MSDLINDFDRLKDPAFKISEALKERTRDPQDSILVLAMVAAFLINTQRNNGVSLEKAQDAFCNMVILLSDAGESDDDNGGLH